MKKILIIDDSEDVCEFLCRLLNRKFEISISINLEQATEALIRESYDIILSDLHIPRESGDDFVLRHREFIGAAHVIFISSDHEDILIQAKNKLLDAGLKKVSYIQKPIVISDLLNLTK